MNPFSFLKTQITLDTISLGTEHNELIGNYNLLYLETCSSVSIRKVEKKFTNLEDQKIQRFYMSYNIIQLFTTQPTRLDKFTRL